MLGTIVNTIAVVVGGLLGLLLKGGLKDNLRQTLTAAMGLAVLFVGISGALQGLLNDDANPILYIIALAVGGVVGELLRIEGRLESLGANIEAKLPPSKDGEPGFARGFVAASLLFCVGTMAVMGSIESGINGNHSILFAKSMLDGIISIVMASALGYGVVFSAVTVLLYQGAITMLAGWIGPYLTADMLREISIVGGILITALGLNQLELTKIKVGNLLPAMFVPVIYYIIIG